VFAVTALRGLTAAGVRGEREREGRRSYSPPYLEQRRCKEAAPWWLARGGGYGSGWRRWELVRGLAVAVRFVVVKGDAGGPFIGEMRRWSGGVGAEAGERCGVVLIVLGIAERGGGSGKARTGDATPRAGGERRRRRYASTGKWQRWWRGRRVCADGGGRGATARQRASRRCTWEGPGAVQAQERWRERQGRGASGGWHGHAVRLRARRGTAA
jgi:hypothetical protein